MIEYRASDYEVALALGAFLVSGTEETLASAMRCVVASRQVDSGTLYANASKLAAAFAALNRTLREGEA